MSADVARDAIGRWFPNGKIDCIRALTYARTKEELVRDHTIDTPDNDLHDVTQRLRDAERLSIKAVMVEAGEDPLPLLRKAGITEFLSVPVALDADTGTAAAFGDGRGSSITATWVPDQHDAGDQHDGPGQHDVDDNFPVGAAADHDGSGTRHSRRTVNLPAAFGLRSMAPIDRNS